MENITLHSITEGFDKIFKEELLGLPPYYEVKHAIELIGTLSKPSSIYKLSTLEDQNL